MTRSRRIRAGRGLAGAIASALLLTAPCAFAQGTGLTLAATAVDVVRLAPGMPVASASLLVSDAS